MSWFKHRPRSKESRPITPHQSGPITRNLWNQVKEKSKKPEEQEPVAKE